MLNRVKIGLILAVMYLAFYKYIDILIALVSLIELISLRIHKKINLWLFIGGAVYLFVFIVSAQGLLSNITLFGNIKISLLHVAILHAIIADTAGYIIGRFFGKHKLAPSISPKKTIEGAAGALIVCVLFGLVINNTLSERWSLLSSLVLGVGAIIGDLLISKAKRMAKLKDSSRVLQEHGGIWDRMDSVILVTILIAVMDKLFYII